MKKLILVLALVFALAFPLMVTADEAETTIDFSGSFKIDVDFDLLGAPLTYGDKLELVAKYDILELKVVLTDLIFEDPMGVDLKGTVTFDITDGLIGVLVAELDIISKEVGVSFEIKF